MKTVLMGNAGAGKSTMAKALIAGRNIPVLPLDEIAWGDGIKRKPLSESIRELNYFIEANKNWIIEGCYGDLIEAALPYCKELRFLNPGIDVCVANCRARPWEPEKFASPQAQEQMLDNLITWVRQYDTRDDEYSLYRHRQIFDNFSGKKSEYRSLAEYHEG